MAETKEEKSARVKKFWADKKEEKQQSTQAPNILHTVDTVAKLNTEFIEGLDDIPELDLPIVKRNKIQQSEPQKQHMTEVLEPVQTSIIPSRVRGTISIKPYVSGEENMGLEKPDEAHPDGLAIMPGAYQMDRIGCDARGNIETYFTGLNEMAPEVQSITDKDRKRAKVSEIRNVVAYLENTVAGNFDINRESCMDNYGTRTDDFWTKVKMFRSSAPIQYDGNKLRVSTYWDSVELKLSNETTKLNLTDPHDLVKFYAIEARGLSMVAPSLKVAIEEQGYKFYMDTPFETADIRTEFKKLRNKAGGLLDDMFDNDEARLFFTAKLCTPVGGSELRRGGPLYTPKDMLYERVCKYIDGESEDRDKRIVLNKFIALCDMDIDELTRRAVVKDAAELHLIEPKSDGRLYYIRMNVPLGKNIEEIVTYLDGTLNEPVWSSLRDDVENEWRS